MRGALLELVAVSRTQIPAARIPGVLLALRDKNDDVRTQAYRVLATRLADADGDAQDLQRGLRDKLPTVRAYSWYLLHSSARKRPGVEFFTRAAKEARTPGVIEAASLVRPIRQDVVALLLEAARDNDSRVAHVAVRGLARMLEHSAPGSPELRASRYPKLGAKVRAKAEATWAWLDAAADRRDDLAGWDCDKHGGHPACDIGVTAMALLGFSAGGVTLRHPKHGDVVARACRYLQRWQQENGCIGDPKGAKPVLQHAIATVPGRSASISAIPTYTTGGRCSMGRC